MIAIPAGPERIGQSSGRIASIQACRAMAACLVVLAHTSVSIFDKPKYWPANPVGNLFDFGHIGVEFFFVLSGFIILSVHWRDIGHPAAARRFLRKRFQRIYPIYWIVLGALLIVYFAVPSFGEGFERDPDIIASSILLVGGFRLSDTLKPVTILPAAWTLYYEVLFYALFLTLIMSRRAGAVLLGIWFTVSALNLLLGPFPGAPALYFAHYNLLFLLGMASAWLIRGRMMPMPGVLALVGMAVFFAAGLQEVGPAWLSERQESLLCGLGSMVALVGLVELERSKGLRVPRFLVLLGEASYTIYLVHLAVLVLLAKLATHIPGRDAVPLVAWYALFFVAAVIAGLVFHLMIERPLLQRLGKGWGRNPRPAIVETGS